MKLTAVVKTLPIVERIIAALDTMPSDEVYPTKELAEKLGMTYRNFASHGSDERLAAYGVIAPNGRGGPQRLWGSKKAVAALKKHMGKDQNEN